MKLSPLIYTCGFIFSVYLGCDAYRDGKEMAEKAETVRAVHYEKTAQWHASTARFKAIKAHIELESKRTETETNVKRVVIAELKKCRRGACK